jgi:hypothetical protein
MKIYLDSLDSFYSINHEAKTKPKKDYAGIGAVIFTFTVLSIVIGLSIYTACQIAYGQMPTIEDQQKANCESIQGTYINGKCMVDRNILELRQQLENSKLELQAKQQGLDSMLNYCFQHADRPNPLQDLIDKGLMSSNMTGITCNEVKQMSDVNQNQISDLDNELNQVGKMKVK